MKESTLDTLGPLLKFLRPYEVLEETQGTKFLLSGKDFIHFHDDSDGLLADLDKMINNQNLSYKLFLNKVPSSKNFLQVLKIDF